MGREPRVVALGGGHGLAATLTALRQVTHDLTAVVTVADDGGSSGRLRAAYDLLPPGDLRMALAALAAPGSAVLRDALQRRFPEPASGAAVGSAAAGSTVAGLAGHPLGNLLLAGLMQQTGDPVAALAVVGGLLGLPATTRVLPMACSPLDIVAEVAGLDAADGPDGPDGPDGAAGRRTVRGQVEVATTQGRVLTVSLLPPDAPACPEALAAVRAADLLVLGPGSLFTSVLPHLLLPQLRAAVTSSPARRILVLNLVPQPGETDGFGPETHLEVLAAQVPELRLDVVVADEAAASTASAGRPGPSSEIATRLGVRANGERGLMGGLEAAADVLGARILLAPLADRAAVGVHDPDALADAFRTVWREVVVR